MLMFRHGLKAVLLTATQHKGLGMITDNLDLLKSISAINANELKLIQLKKSEKHYPVTAIEELERQIIRHKLEIANHVLMMARTETTGNYGG